MKAALAAFGLGIVVFSAGVQGACPTTLVGAGIQSARHDLVFAFEPGPASVGVPFALAVEICAKDGAGTLSRVDADMPEHRHGMNYAPSIVATGQGRFRAEGFLFHMPGRWRLLFDLPGERLETFLTVE